MTNNPFKLSSTGSNYRRHGKNLSLRNYELVGFILIMLCLVEIKNEDFKDPSLTAFSHKYGAQTLLKNHPSVDVRKTKIKL